MSASGSTTLPDSLSIAFSPCPNDTFVFHALVHGLIPGAPAFNVTYADIDVTNRLVQQGSQAESLDVLKISYAALPSALDQYELLPSGGALGRGCGPLVLVRDPHRAEHPSPRGLAGAVVGIPSELSSAYRLFQLWMDETPCHIRVLPFNEIMSAVAASELDAGLVIHEARFTYPSYGLHCLIDLGQWWENRSEAGLPIPLGAIVARRSLGASALAELAELIRASVDYAWANPAASAQYVMQHAQEMDPEVARAHIALYVNEFTRDLGAENNLGYAAVKAFVPNRHLA